MTVQREATPAGQEAYIVWEGGELAGQARAQVRPALMGRSTNIESITSNHHRAIPLHLRGRSSKATPRGTGRREAWLCGALRQQAILMSVVAATTLITHNDIEKTLMTPAKFFQTSAGLIWPGY